MGMYNSVQKYHYLNTLKDSANVTTLFLKISKVEKRIGKDACDFVPEEIEDLIFSIKSKSIAYLKSVINMLTKYTDWCIIDNRRNINNINFYQIFNIMNIKVYDNFIDLDFKEKRYPMINDFEKMIEDLNPIDRLMMYLLYNGVGGPQLCELRNMKDIDIEDNNICIRNINGDFERTLPCPTKMIYYVATAKDEEVYGRNNVVSKLDMNSDLVFKPALRKNSKDKISNMTLYDRYKKACSDIGLSPYFTDINNIKLASIVNLSQILYFLDPTFIESSEFFRVLRTLHLHKPVQSGAPLKNKILFNLLNTDSDILKIHTNYLTTYISRLHFIKIHYFDNDRVSNMINRMIKCLNDEITRRNNTEIRVNTPANIQLGK